MRANRQCAVHPTHVALTHLKVSGISDGTEVSWHKPSIPDQLVHQSLRLNIRGPCIHPAPQQYMHTQTTSTTRWQLQLVYSHHSDCQSSSHHPVLKLQANSAGKQGKLFNMHGCSASTIHHAYAVSMMNAAQGACAITYSCTG